MSADDRGHTQDSFMKSERDVVVATIAFGMGVDKANIRQVVCVRPFALLGVTFNIVSGTLTCPRRSRITLRSASRKLSAMMRSTREQEIGRAGRDGQQSECLLFLCAADMPTLEGFARGNTPSRNSIRDWLATISKASPSEDGCIDFSSCEQSKTCVPPIHRRVDYEG